MTASRAARPLFLCLVFTGLAACEQSLTMPQPTPVVPAATAGRVGTQCTVFVAEHRMDCVRLAPAPVKNARLLGGQDVYVKLASSGTTYDGGTQILSSDVTMQNLLRQSMGTTDGTTVAGSDVFFNAPPVTTSGTGTVTLANADGQGTFTNTNQDYFHYAQILSPYEISAAKNWLFNVPATVNTFTFTVYVNAPLQDESGPLLDEVWSGTSSTSWQTAGNWTSNIVPDSASTVSIPADSLLPSHVQPVLTADAVTTNLRVGFASSLALAGFTMTTYGNVDAVGSITGGTLVMAGSSRLLGGTVNALDVTGSVSLQRATTATGAVTVQDGALAVKDRSLTIAIP